ncbi:metal-sulfur cluster assembly factor [Candidatus Woesearchaeota archaeon]|nr:metal-sulfur cluster assembly factor [Candidatus Woesearchaeota archaeon]
MATKEEVISALKTCYDPELQIDVWTLGLIYEINLPSDDKAEIKMTLTTPFCPYGPALLEDIENAVKNACDVDVDIELVFDPPWQPSEELRAMLGL